MSITQCPECGGTLSSTVTTCIHCGCKIATCPECGKRFIEESKKCPICGYEMELQSTAQTPTQPIEKPKTPNATTPPKPELFNFSSEPLDKAMADWKKTYNPDSTFLDFSSLFFIVLLLFCIPFILIAIWVNDSAYQLILSPVFLFAFAMLMIGCIFGLIASIHRVFKNASNQRSFMNYCESNNIALTDLISPTVDKLASRVGPVKIKDENRTSFLDFHIALTTWVTKVLGSNFALNLISAIFSSIVTCSVLGLFAFHIVIKPLSEQISFITEGFGPLIFMAVLLAFIIITLSIPKNYTKRAKKSVAKQFPKTNNFKGKYSALIIYFP